MLPASSFPLQPGPLLARCDLQLCCLLHPALFLLPQSDLLMLRVFTSFPHFFQFPSLRMVPCCHFYFHSCEMAFLDPYVLSFLLWATPWRHPLFSLLISTLFSSPSEASFISQILFIYSLSMDQMKSFFKGRECARITKPWSWECTFLLHKARNPILSFIKTREAEGQHKKKSHDAYVAELSVPVPQEQICWNVF